MAYPRKLTEAQRKAIARAYRPYMVSLKALAAKYKVSQSTIADAARKYRKATV